MGISKKMENGEQWIQNIVSTERLSSSQNSSLIDSSNLDSSKMRSPQRNQTILSSSPNERQQIVKNYVDLLSRGSMDDDLSSHASSYDDHSSTRSSEDGALRERGNGTALFVPEGHSSVTSESGYFSGIKNEGDSTLASVDLQQVPVSKYEELELRILRQPEEQHRARYMSEGSRGSVKDRSGKSHVTVALRGYNRPAILEIFASIGNGPVVPHPLYRLIPVTGKNGSSVTSCKESVTADGAACLQVVLRPESKMTAVLDCIGILKICSYDLKRKLPKQNRNASVRLVFRVTVPAYQNRRQNIVLQTVSLPIICAQQPGYPDISRISCTSSSVRGNVDVFIVGKNFSGNATVYMKEYGPDGKIIWSSPAVVDQQHTHSCHMICTVPPYRDLFISNCVEVMLTVECGKKISRPLSFKYFPDNAVPTTVQGPTSGGQMQMTFDSPFSMDQLGGSSTTTSDSNAQQQNFWSSANFTQQDHQQQQQQQFQQQQQQQPMMSNNATVVEQANSLNLPQDALSSNSFADFVESTSKLEPFSDEQKFLDEQNASFYQATDKPPAAKKQCGPFAFASNDPLTFSMDDVPQLFA